ncbi:MAG TPA: CAP domain-containing protein [Afifellaceae bacterium]|nr:CAP domain-containing protein [Afifellaceae bacterium]
MAIQNDISDWFAAVSRMDGINGHSASARTIDNDHATQLINAIRARHGAGAVVHDHRLADLALNHALDMASNGRVTSSFGPGGNLGSRIARAGMRGTAAENIGAGHSTVDSLLQDWQRSRGHRQNLVDRRMTHFGLAAAANPVSRYRAYWALVLFRPASH